MTSRVHTSTWAKRCVDLLANMAPVRPTPSPTISHAPCIGIQDIATRCPIVWPACLGAATNLRATGRPAEGGGEKRKDENLARTRAFAAFAGLAYSFSEQFNLLQFAVSEVVSTNSVNTLPLLHTLGFSMHRSTFTRCVSSMADMAKQAFAVLYRAIPLLQRFTYLIGDNVDKVYVVCCAARPCMP